MMSVSCSRGPGLRLQPFEGSATGAFSMTQRSCRTPDNFSTGRHGRRRSIYSHPSIFCSIPHQKISNVELLSTLIKCGKRRKCRK